MKLNTRKPQRPRLRPDFGIERYVRPGRIARWWARYGTWVLYAAAFAISFSIPFIPQLVRLAGF